MHNELHQLIKATVKTGEVKLSSGKISNFYVDCRQVTLNTRGSVLVGEAVLEAVYRIDATAVGGPVTGACPMVTAAGVLTEDPLKLFYVRTTPKEHGLRKSIEGASLSINDRVLLVDDVCTSGGSLVRAIECLREEADCAMLDAFVLVDREEGGRERLKKIGVYLTALFTKSELM